MMYYPMFNFFFNDTATTEIYTLSLHDALPIWVFNDRGSIAMVARVGDRVRPKVVSIPSGWWASLSPSGSSANALTDRKSTRLNSSHANISYAVFCLKKKSTEY